MKKILMFSLAAFVISLTAIDAITPQDVLSDDKNQTVLNETVVRKGTVGATLANLKEWEGLVAAQVSLEDPSWKKLIEDQEALMPAFHALGFFDLFRLEEWLDPAGSESRALLAILELKRTKQVPTEQEARSLNYWRIHGSEALRQLILDKNESILTH